MLPATTPNSTAAPHAQPHAWAWAYAQQLREQESLLRRLDELSLTQRAMIDAEDPQPLLRLLDQRQQLVDRLSELYELGRPMREQLAASAGTLPADLHGQLRTLLDAVSSLAQGVMRRDAKDQERLHQRKKQAQQELAEIASGKRAARAYAAPMGDAPPPSFQDRQG